LEPFVYLLEYLKLKNIDELTRLIQFLVVLQADPGKSSQITSS